MTPAPYLVIDADPTRPLATIQLNVYPDRIVATELGNGYRVHQTPQQAAEDVERRCARVLAAISGALA